MTSLNAALCQALACALDGPVGDAPYLLNAGDVKALQPIIMAHHDVFWQVCSRPLEAV